VTEARTHLSEQGPHRHEKHGRQGTGAGPRGNKWWTLVAVCLGTFMLLLDVTIVNVALPDIQQALTSSFADLQWVVDAYALTLAAFLLTAGSVADMYGRRRMYLIGLVVFTCASVLCGFAVTTLMLQLSRALQGVGGAIMFAVSLALLADAFRGKDRGVAFGAWGAVTGLAVAIGPLLGGLLTSGLSWRWIFFVNAPIGIAAVLITLAKVVESRAAACHPAGLGWLRPLHGGAVQPGLRADRVEPEVLHRPTRARLLRRGGGAAGRLRPRRAAQRAPDVRLKLFMLPTFSGGSVAAFGVSASIFAMILYLVLYLQDILGYSALATGVRLMVLSGGILATSAVAGRLSSRVPVRLLIGPGLIIIGIGLLLMRGLDAGLSLDAPHSRAHRGRCRSRDDEPAAGLHGRRRRAAAAGRDGLRHQLHVPPGGDRTGIALLGTLFSNKVSAEVVTRVARVPGLSHRGPQIATAVQSGEIRSVIGKLPEHARQAVGTITRAAFTTGLNHILLVAAIIALASGVVALVAIRSRDFAQQGALPGGPGQDQADNDG